MSKKVITYDVGTTGLKSCLFQISAEESVRFIASEVESYKLHVLDNGGVEQDPLDWWNAMAVSTKKLLEKTGIPKEEIGGISFCSQYLTVVLVDQQGKALRRAMSCMDARADKQFRDCMSTGLQFEGLNIFKVLKYLRITGAVSASAKDPAWKYLWVKENEPEIFQKTYKWLDAKEYLTCRATGNIMASRDDASATFLYDVKHDCWSKELCAMLGVDMKHLPDICASTDQVGGLLPQAAEELGLAPGTPVFSGGSDVSLCQVGAGCVEEGDANIYAGTSGWVCTTVNKLHLDLDNLIASLMGVDPTAYCYIAEVETAGKCMEWVKERMSHTPITTYTELYACAGDSPAGSNGVVFSPWMHGNRCPFEDANARGLFFNVDVDTRCADLVRAVLEGICFHMRWLLECTEKTFPVTDIRFSGGGSLSPVMCQIMADVTGRTIETVENTRLVGAMGAAALMAVSFGMLDDIKKIKSIIKVDAVYQPDPANTAVYNKIFPVFKDLYKNNKKAYAALNG